MSTNNGNNKLIPAERVQGEPLAPVQRGYG